MTASRISSAWSCTVRLVVDDDRALSAASADLAVLLERVDATASRFRPDSALSIANAHAGRPVPVPALLVDLVGAALEAATDTDGAVDPTLGLAMHRIGYDRDIATLRASEPSALPAIDDSAACTSAVAPVGSTTGPPTSLGRWRAVRMHREAGLLTVPRHTALDLGATAKAWTADHAARTLAARYGTGVLVEIGGDLAVGGQREGGWCVRVAEREGADGQLVSVDRGGITTSTTVVRTWQHDSLRVHHIVDPSTSRSADGPWRTASVHAASALAANVASTASIVKGDAALDWLTARGIAARLIAQDGSVVTTPGWPADQVGHTLATGAES